MKTIELTKAQVQAVIKSLANVHDSSDTFDVNVEVGGEIVVNANGWVDIYGHVEDDATCGYENGTGAFVEDGRDAYVELTAFDEDGTEYQIARENVQIVNDYLNAT